MLTPWKKSYNQPRQHIKIRDITLPTKACLIKAMVFPVVMYGCESWTITKTEHWRADAFELWCWRRLLRVPWTARRSNQSFLKGMSPEYSLEGLMLKLKLQYFGHLMWRADSLEGTLMLGKIEGGRRRGQQRIGGWMASPTQWTWVWVNSGSWWWTGRPGMLQSMGSQWTGHDWATELNFSEGIDSVFLYILHTHTHTQNIPQCLFQNVFNKNDNTCYKSTQKARTKMILWIQFTERLPSHWSSNSIKSSGNKTV